MAENPVDAPKPRPGPAAGLVYHAGALGDFVLSLPAVFRVAAAHPELTWRFWGPADRLALLPNFRPAPADLLRAGHTLWGAEPDPAVLRCLGEARLVLAFGGRQPPPWNVPAAVRLVRVASFPPAGGEWVPAHQARQMDAQGVPPLRVPWLPAWRSRILTDPFPSEILVHPGSGDPHKNLPAAAWAEVLEELQALLPAAVLLGPAEQERGDWESLVRAADAVRTCATLGELLAVLPRARLLLGNDSGVSHLAAALGIPTVAAFGPSDPRLWKPLGSRVRIVQTGRACAPCSAGEPIGCREPACWESLPARAIVAAAKELLAETHRDR
ncbi:MAG: glycosyltransferase family 9 protein [Deferrisomatales bacterium]